MRILLTNNHLNTYGGTETWTLTVYNKLKQLGHEVDVFTFQSGGGVSDMITDWHDPHSKKEYDLALVNHQSCLMYVKQNVTVKYIKFISHGTVPFLEQPILGANEYISISTEVQTHLQKKGFKSKVIHNPIDLDVYKPTKPLSRSPRSAFVLCQNQTAQMNVDYLGYITKKTPSSRALRVSLAGDGYNDSDVVVGLGRSAMEGLACGRPVIVYDNRHYNYKGSYDGVITKNNIEVLLTKNFSGRVFNRVFEPILVKEEFEKLYVNNTEYYRALAEEYFDASKIVVKLIEH